MDAQELRNLQKAYMEVVMGEGVVDSPYDRAQTDRADAYGRASTNRGDAYGRAQKKKKKKPFYYDEQKNIYDIILSHLLDEGYAETPEAAEAIMVNMSEDWRQSIVETIAGEPDTTNLNPVGRAIKTGAEILKGVIKPKPQVKKPPSQAPMRDEPLW